MKNKIGRIIALVLVLLMVGLVFLTLYLAVTGSRYFMASMFSMFLVPILAWTYMYIYRLMQDRDRDQDKTEPEKRN